MALNQTQIVVFYVFKNVVNFTFIDPTADDSSSLVVLHFSWVVTCRVQLSRPHVFSQACFHTLQHGGTRDTARAASSLTSPPLCPMRRLICRKRPAPLAEETAPFNT